MRTTDRSDNDEPKIPKSITAKEDPKRVKPYTDIAAPNRQKLRKERDEPIITKSSTDSDEPMRDRP